MDFLQPDERRIRELFQGEGAAFTSFCDALIRTHSAALGLLDSEIETTSSVSDPDGGVDTKVRQNIPGDSSGWFCEKTAWQYKAKSYENVEKEFSKLLIGDYLKNCIKDNYAYRLTVADSLTSEQRTLWENRLKASIAQINPQAPAPRVVTAADLAALAARYPAFVLRQFYSVASSLALDLNTWKQSITVNTPIFVSISKWHPVQEKIRGHLNLSNAVPSVVVTIQGEAGVGKSRLVYETVAALPGAEGLVLYCEDSSKAIDLVRQAASWPQTRLIVIADECGPEERLTLKKIGEGHKARLRIVAIDNSQIKADRIEPESMLENMAEESLLEVLNANFSMIPAERLRSYASLAQGFPRFAADLCNNDNTIAPGGHLGPALRSVHDYLDARLSGRQWQALQALALVSKVGFRGEVSQELDILCEALKLSRSEVEQDLSAIQAGPGFATRGSRYYYVTPEVVARVAFAGAWKRWASDDPTDFLSKFPVRLSQSFLHRVRKSAEEEVRRSCASFFRRWVNSASITDLAKVDFVRQLIVLIEVYPQDYLPALRRILESSKLESIEAISSKSYGIDWGPRRRLVGLLEGLMQFPEHLLDAEACLLRLALAETELGIGNNSTAIWCQIYSIGLSGTATPFPERLHILKQRAQDQDFATRKLVLEAANAALSLSMRMAGPATVAGRIPPPEWYPHSWQEQNDGHRSVVELIGQLIRKDMILRPQAIRLLIQHTRMLIGQSLHSEVQTVLASVELTDWERAKLLEAIDSYLVFDAKRSTDEDNSDKEVLAAQVKAVQAWRDSLVGSNLHYRMIELIGRQGFDVLRYKNETAWKAQVAELAMQLLSSSEKLAAELPWLLSGTVHSAADLGISLGEQDASARLLNYLLTEAMQTQHRAFVRGYIYGLLQKHSEHSILVNDWLDKQEQSVPNAVAEYALTAGDHGHALTRILRLYDQGKLPASYLHERNFFNKERIASGGLQQLLDRLVSAARHGDATAIKIGLDSISLHVPYDAKEQAPKVFSENSSVAEYAWSLLEQGLHLDPSSLLHWDSILLNLASLAPMRAARFACRVMFGRDRGFNLDGERVLCELARRFPSETMEAVGECMLDAKLGVLFFVGNYRRIFASIPDDTIIAWLNRSGVEGARKLARYLPLPRVSGNEAKVPALTEFVLRRFEEDDRTFHEFCAGAHSFQVYRGNIASAHETEGDIARRFLNHPLRRIREWAAIEEKSSMAEANFWRERHEDVTMPE